MRLVGCALLSASECGAGEKVRGLPACQVVCPYPTSSLIPADQLPPLLCLDAPPFCLLPLLPRSSLHPFPLPPSVHPGLPCLPATFPHLRADSEQANTSTRTNESASADQRAQPLAAKKPRTYVQGGGRRGRDEEEAAHLQGGTRGGELRGKRAPTSRGSEELRWIPQSSPPRTV